MATARAFWKGGPVRAVLIVAAASCAGGCATAGKANPFAYGPIDQTSPVAADIKAAQAAPGHWPGFDHVPPVPTDVRPALAWRASVYETWGLKRGLEAEAAAIPFALAPGEAEAWAQAERAKIPPAELTAPASDAASESEAFAAAQRARATPPPPPK